MTGIDYQEIKPDAPLSDFVDSFWMLSNHSDQEKPVIIVPDGRIDLFFSFQEPYELTLLGLGSEPSHASLTPGSRFFAVSFKLLAIDYLFDRKFPTLVDSVYRLPPDYFGITTRDFQAFDHFCGVLSNHFISQLPADIDPRKQNLFALMYASDGSIPIQEIAETVNWSSRQINRYFNQRFGISLKAYCTILRFRASFRQLKEGKLFPEQDFTDQSHFIKNVRKFAGVTPRELSKNENDRFIQFSTLPKK